MLTVFRFLLDNNQAPVVEDLHLEEGPPALDLEKGQIYLYKPSEEEKQADPGVPFYLVKIKSEPSNLLGAHKTKTMVLRLAQDADNLKTN